MKAIMVKTQLAVSVDMGEVDTNGTSLQGYLPDGTGYRDVVRVFGKSQRGKTGDNKIGVLWAGRINGLVFTIYDYRSCIDPRKNMDWHIGGWVPMTADLVNLYFKAR